MSSSISPDSQNFDTADQAAMEMEGMIEEAMSQVKDEQGPKSDDTHLAEMKVSEDGECHPVDAGEIVDHGDDDAEAEEEHVVAEGLRDPGQPSPAERAEHDLTHIPYRPWCKHCVRGKAKGRQSRRLRDGQSQSTCPRIRLDY